MICRKCGANLPDNVLRCSVCGIKVNMYCPECKTLNPFGAKVCKNCGFELIKICPDCRCVNIYSAKECHKCGHKFEITTPNTNKNESVKAVTEEKKPEFTPRPREDFDIVRPFSCTETAYSVSDLPDLSKNADNIENTENTDPVEKENYTPEANQYHTGFYTNKKNKSKSKNDIENIVLPEIKSEETKNSNSDTESAVIDNAENDKTSEIEKIFYVEKEPDIEEIQNLKEEPPVINPVDKDKKEEIINSVFDSEKIDIEPIQEVNVRNLNVHQEDTRKIIPETPQTNETDKEDLNVEVQPEAVKKIVHLLTSSLNKHIIAVNGEEGRGKSAVLSQVRNIMSTKGFVCLYGSCTPLIQITSFGFFQDAFLRILGFPPYTRNIEAFIKDFKKSSFSKVFSFLEGNELTLFLNIFYPDKKDKFDNILENRKIMFSILEKVIKSFLLNSDLIIAIDNFELLDGASYDFIMNLMKKGYFNNRLKIVAAYKENKSIQSYFDLSDSDEDIFETILIKEFDRTGMIKAVNNSIMMNIEELLDDALITKLIEKSEGNAVRMEQEIALLFDSGYIGLSGNNVVIDESKKPEIEPSSFEELIKLRINLIAPSIKNVLFTAAIAGYRFAADILCLAVTMPREKAEQVLKFLYQELFITPVDKYTYEFKSLTLWKLIYKEAQKDLLYKENSQRLYYTLRPLTLSSNLQKLISCTEALNKDEEYIIWQETASISAKLGDTNLYVIAQKQCLKLIEEQKAEDKEEEKAQIYEKIGKLLCEKSPVEAITYLSNVLDADIKANNTQKVIDLSGYFIKSCYLTGNYFGANEACNAVIAAIKGVDSDVSDLEIALIKTRKLNALFNIGNSEQIVNLVKEEILPELNKGLISLEITMEYKSLVINAWFTSNLVLAMAYGQQGNNEIFNTITELRQFCEKYEYNNFINNTRIDLIEAFANTVIGQIAKSNELLNIISEKYKSKNMEPKLLAQWNFLNIINRVLSGQFEDLKGDLFELAAFANNINEHFIKNIVKLILGYVIKEDGNIKKALEIYNEEITYFAKEKVAIGALLAWALIVKLTTESGDYDKALNTAQRALEIAQSPKINNYFFIIYFQKFIAEIYLRQEDFSSAKMYIEKAVMLAKQFDLKYQIIELYIFYGSYLEAFMRTNKNYSRDYVKLSAEMYDKALKSAKELQINNLIELAAQKLSGFKTFCQLNSINL